MKELLSDICEWTANIAVVAFVIGAMYLLMTQP